MSTSKSPERLIAFTDAVVAIAMTLLILPLTEVVGELVSAHGSPREAVTGHWWQIFSFLLSFAVIARVWVSHHRLFAEVNQYSTALVQVDLCWLLTIVVLPFPTELVGAFGRDQFTLLFYIGTILAGSACQTAMALIIRRDENVARSPDSISDSWWMTMLVTTATLVLALLLAAVVPAVGFYVLLILALPPYVVRWWYRRNPGDGEAEVQ
jgi:uncharacterized membrane protein